MSNSSSTPMGTPGTTGQPPQRSWFARHKVLTGLGILVVLIIAISVATSGDGSNTATPEGTATTDAAGAEENSAADQQTPPADETQPGLGDPVRDGAFEFVVSSVEPGPAIIGDETFGVRPQGEFLLVTVTVTNIGDEPGTLFGDNQYLYAGQRQFSADTEAALYLEDSSTLAEEINPGNTVTGVLVYDVPKGTQPTHLELHDSAFSSGVTVTLK